jgi:hypothetical protein
MEKIILKKEQFEQLKKNLEDFQHENDILRQKLHEKGVIERKVFRVLKTVKNKLMTESGEIDSVKALELFTDDTARAKFFAEISELKEVLQYYEKNTVFIHS